MIGHARGIGLAVVLLLLYPTYSLAFDIPPNDGFVTDAIALLPVEDERALEQDLRAYRQATSNEIAVVIVENLQGEEPSDVAVQIGREWGVGTEQDNGILLLVSYADRQIWIATGYGLEGAVPDLVAHGIAEREIAPHFRDGDYAAGIRAGIDALKKHIGGEYTAERYTNEEGGSGFIWALFFLFILFEYAAAWLAKSKSWWAGGLLGGALGLILAVAFSWWISMPVLVVLGFAFDYIVSKTGIRPRGRGGRWGGGGFGGTGGRGGGGFGGGSFGGGGGGSGW